MANVSWLVVILVFFFDITAFGLALGAMARRSTGQTSYDAPGYVYCQYTKDVSTGLAVVAGIFLIIGQVTISTITRCLCCGRATYKPSSGRICAIILFVFSWVAFLVALILLLAGASENTIRTKGSYDVGTLDNNLLYCRHVRKALFGAASAFTFLTMVCSLIYYFLITKAEMKEAPWQSYQGDAYSGDAPTVGMTAYN